MISTRQVRRGLLAAVVGAFALAGCQNALDVANPKYIDETQLNDPALASVLLNTAVGALNANYSEFTWYSAIITDEALNATNDFHSGELSQRIVELAQGNVSPYPLIQFSRATADSAAGRLRAISTNKNADLKLSRALSYAGFAYIQLGEDICEAPLNGGAMVQNDSMQKIAVSRFKEAISAATGATTTPADKAVSDSLLNLARIGAARASLNLGDKANAIAYASAVTNNNFVVYADYIVSGNTALQNSLWGRVNGQNKQLGVHPLMQGLNDPRVRYVTKAVLGHNQLTLLNVPYSPRSFSTFTYVDSTPILANSSIDMASGLEARYIRAEAEGPTALTIALVNERRAYGNEPVLPAGADVMAALREEKRRDFFLSGRRLGDLRRYLKQGVGDFFPSGPHPTKEWGLYGSATCYILSQDELNSNPNIAGYKPPATRPPGYSP